MSDHFPRHARDFSPPVDQTIGDILPPMELGNEHDPVRVADGMVKAIRQARHQALQRKLPLEVVKGANMALNVAERIRDEVVDPGNNPHNDNPYHFVLDGVHGPVHQAGVNILDSVLNRSATLGETLPGDEQERYFIGRTVVSVETQVNKFDNPRFAPESGKPFAVNYRVSSFEPDIDKR